MSFWDIDVKGSKKLILAIFGPNPIKMSYWAIITLFWPSIGISLDFWLILMLSWDFFSHHGHGHWNIWKFQAQILWKWNIWSIILQFWPTIWLIYLWLFWYHFGPFWFMAYKNYWVYWVKNPKVIVDGLFKPMWSFFTSFIQF